MSDDKTVTIGSKAIRIDTITGWKFMESAELIAKITEALPGIYNRMEEFSQQRMKSTEKVYTRAAALASFGEELKDITPEWWEANGNEMRLPGPRPSIQEQVIYVFPEAFKQARPLVARLLAVLSVPNDELFQASSGGGEDAIDVLLTKWADEMLFHGSIADLVKIAVMAVEAFRREATQDPEVKALLARLAQMFISPESLEDSTLTTDAAPEETSSASPIPDENESSPKQGSLSDSPGSSDGTTGPSSTPPPGASSETSEPALTSGG
jgi:hypothetical protein